MIDAVAAKGTATARVSMKRFSMFGTPGPATAGRYDLGIMRGNDLTVSETRVQLPFIMVIPRHGGRNRVKRVSGIFHRLPVGLPRLLRQHVCLRSGLSLTLHNS
jgi:hypothetical protein